jgi:hypothetical protein
MVDPRGASPKKPPVEASLEVSHIGEGIVGTLTVSLGGLPSASTSPKPTNLGSTFVLEADGKRFLG